MAYLHYSLPSIPSISSHSSTSSELSLCSDDFCIFPFGPACEKCYFNNTIKHDLVDSHVVTRKLIDWLEEMGVRCEFEEAKGRLFDGGAGEKDGDGEVVEYEGEESRSLLPFVQSLEPRPISQSCVSIALKSASSESNPPTLVISETQDNEPVLAAKLTPWLNTLFDNTLSGHKEETVFAGGADVEEGVKDPCPYCNQSQGDERLQHKMRCKYAHEEKENEERMMGYY